MFFVSSQAVHETRRFWGIWFASCDSLTGRLINVRWFELKYFKHPAFTSMMKALVNKHQDIQPDTFTTSTAEFLLVFCVLNCTGCCEHHELPSTWWQVGAGFLGIVFMLALPHTSRCFEWNRSHCFRWLFRKREDGPTLRKVADSFVVTGWFLGVGAKKPMACHKRVAAKRWLIRTKSAQKLWYFCWFEIRLFVFFDCCLPIY